MLFKSLDYIVKNVLLEAQEDSEKNYAYYLQLCSMGAREANYMLPINIKTQMISYDGAKRFIDLPSDCVEYTKIGVLRGDKIYPLGLNKSLAVSHNYNGCGITQPWPLWSKGQDFFPFNGDFAFYNYYWNGVWGTVYGYGPLNNNIGEYNYDSELNRIVFGAGMCTSTEIYLEYKSNGVQPDGCILIPDELVNQLVEYVHWRRIKFDRKETTYLKERQRKDYIAAKKATRRRLGPSISEYYDYSFTAFTQGPKG